MNVFINDRRKGYAKHSSNLNLEVGSDVRGHRVCQRNENGICKLPDSGVVEVRLGIQVEIAVSPPNS